MIYSTSKITKTQDLSQRMKLYRSASFVKSAAKLEQMPEDEGFEVAIVGRSNAGKSSFLNYLTNQKGLAKTSKTPGRTQLMNVFSLAYEQRRIIDLPGYGFAKVAHSQRFDWEKHLADYFSERQSLAGVVLLMDIRHPLQELDLMMLEFLLSQQLPVYILLTKADKLSRNKANTQLNLVKKQLSSTGLSHQLQTFSIHDPLSLVKVADVLDEWLEIPEGVQLSAKS
jgi:GTP-binding protein